MMRDDIGSEFPWSGLPRGPRTAWPRPLAWFGLGRDAVTAVCRERLRGGARLLVPTYFCGEVVAGWRAGGLPVASYADDPRRAAPDWDRLRVAAGDAVLAVNYFGVRRPDGWLDWKSRQPGVLLIEDHTHDPLAPWPRASGADFAFASLRKTLPVSDGAILWSPAGHDLPPEPAAGDWTGSALKLAGMIWKREYLRDGAVDESVKRAYRRFESEGERFFQQHPGQGVAAWNRALLLDGMPDAWRQRRAANVRRFVAAWQARQQARPDAELLFGEWPAGACPLNPVLVFQNAAARESCRRRLIDARIFPPVHWPLAAGECASSQAIDLSSRMLTIPLDFRCDVGDVERILKCLFTAGDAAAPSATPAAAPYRGDPRTLVATPPAAPPLDCETP